VKEIYGRALLWEITLLKREKEAKIFFLHPDASLNLTNKERTALKRDLFSYMYLYWETKRLPMY